MVSTIEKLINYSLLCSRQINQLKQPVMWIGIINFLGNVSGQQKYDNNDGYINNDYICHKTTWLLLSKN